MMIAAKRYRVGQVDDFPIDGGACVRIENKQIAIFNFASRNEWFACENACPHTGTMVLSRGLIGDQKGEPKVSCPMHKKSFSLTDGRCLNDASYSVKTYPVTIENGEVFLQFDETARSNPERDAREDRIA